MIKKNISPDPGLRLRHLREKLGLSRAEFSEITGMSASTMRSIEVGDLELSPSKALLYSHIFTLLFEMDPKEASADVLLYGEQRNSQTGRKTIIVRKG